MKQFPEIILPKKLNDFNNNYKNVIESHLISKVLKPEKPLKPEEPKEPEKPQEFGFYIFLIPLFFTIFVFVMTKYNLVYTSLTYFGILFFVIYNFNSDKKTYEENLLKFNQNKNLFPKQLVEFENKTFEYEQNLKLYNDQIVDIRQKLEDRNFLHRNRFDYIKEKKLLSSRRPDKVYKNVNRGKTEGYFLEFLNKFFEDEIYTDKIIEVFEYYNSDYDYFQKNKNAYVPDFVFIHYKSELTIDIEIDEPYFEDKPIHCIYEPHDDKRNEYFNNCGLIIIRFSEEQIKNDPVGCCVEIAHLIFYFTGDYSYIKKLENRPKVYRHKKWTHKEAEFLMNKNFRNLKNGKMEEILKNLH